ncbi:hypothetical protein ACEN9X_09370 [Mucilaginibacter sp. Mucisp86]|uniref:hypothetical protein n=1 Tax=Mucilaginibacter sp. Mucisp86 TaxID=3243060 RepID=UPI0039B5FC68
MAFIRIPVAIVTLIIVCFNSTLLWAQKSYVPFIKNLATKEDEQYKVSDSSNEVYILVTEKNCAKCFSDVCDFLSVDSFKNYPVKIVAITNYDLLKLLPLASRYKKLIVCGQDVLFHYMKENEYPEIYSSPSPQLIIKHGLEVRYFNYGETIELTKGKIKG